MNKDNFYITSILINAYYDFGFLTFFNIYPFN